MKKILFSLLAGATMLLGSCSKESAENIAPATDATTFTVEVAELQTRATSTIAPTRYIMEVYDATGTTAQEVIKNADGVLVSHYEIGNGTFTAHLDKTKAYTCLFWADGSAANTQTGVYDAASLKAVKLNTGKVAAEAYYTKVDVAQEKTPAVAVTLKRAVAKITLFETASVEADKQISVTYSNNTSFNALDGMAGVAQADYVSSITTVADKLSGVLGEFYMLSSAGGATLDLSIQYASETAKSLTNVPVKQNFNTNIKGEFSNLTNKTFTVTADDTWNSPDINKPLKAGIILSATTGANGAPVYEIYTAAGLKAFADIINGAGTAYEFDGIQIPAASSKEQCKSNAILKESIDLSEVCGAEVNWKPIGDIGNLYTGVFDGNGKTIKNLYINDHSDWTAVTESFWSTYGFFGYTKDATIKNLTMAGSITSDCKGNNYSTVAGGVCGVLSGSTMTNCHSSVSINIKVKNIGTDYGGIDAGGIVGSLSFGSRIERSTSSSEVRAEFEAPAGTYALMCLIGGIVGDSYESDIINCHHDSGTVSAYSDNYWCHVGGIAGLARFGEVFGCVNNSPVQGKVSKCDTQIGGICGSVEDEKVAACYNTGGLTIVEGTTTYNAGGVSGRIFSSDIIACYSSGTITDNTSGATGSYKGGLLGELGDSTPPSSLSQCWFIGTSGNGIGSSSSTNADGGFVADATALNSKVAGMNTAIKTYNDAAEADKKCLFRFVDGGTKSPLVEAGAPN